MKIKQFLKENYKCVKINGILHSLTTDEQRIYEEVKSKKKVFKKDLDEYDNRVASTMVSKGLLRRCKQHTDEGQGRIYYITHGRLGKIKGQPLEEVAPPDTEIEKWIKKNKKTFKDKYGDKYAKYLYGKAWNKFNGKELKESVNDTVNNHLERAIKLTNIPKDWLAPITNDDADYYLNLSMDRFDVSTIKKANSVLAIYPQIEVYGKLKQGSTTFTIESPIKDNGNVDLEINNDGYIHTTTVLAILKLLNTTAASYEEPNVDKPEMTGEEFDEAYKPTSMETSDEEAVKKAIEHTNLPVRWVYPKSVTGFYYIERLPENNWQIIDYNDGNIDGVIIPTLEKGTHIIELVGDNPKNVELVEDLTSWASTVKVQYTDEGSNKVIQRPLDVERLLTLLLYKKVYIEGENNNYVKEPELTGEEFDEAYDMVKSICKDTYTELK